MEAALLANAPAEIERVVNTGTSIDITICPLLNSFERDIRYNVIPPFTEATANQLSSLVRALLKNIVEDLGDAPNSNERPVTAPAELERLKCEGGEILDCIGPYLNLARFHFDKRVEERRLDRLTTEVSKEVDDISGRAAELKKRILQYLRDLLRLFEQADI